MISGMRVDASAERCEAVSKSDTTKVSYRALYIGGAGDVVIKQKEDGSDAAVTFVGVPAGTILPVACTRVMNATSATNIVGMSW